MPELSKEDIIALRETHDKVIKIETLLGNGNEGLCYDVKCTKQRVSRLELIIVGLISSGALGGGILGLVKWLS